MNRFIKIIFVSLLISIVGCGIPPENISPPNQVSFSRTLWDTATDPVVWQIQNISLAIPEDPPYQRATIRFITDYRISGPGDRMVYLTLNGQHQVRGGGFTIYVGMRDIVMSVDQSSCTNISPCYVYEAPIYFFYLPDASSGYSIVGGNTLTSGRILRVRIDICAAGHCLVGEEQVVQVQIEGS